MTSRSYLLPVALSVDTLSCPRCATPPEEGATAEEVHGVELGERFVGEAKGGETAMDVEHAEAFTALVYRL
jgi:hypothetical protein